MTALFAELMALASHRETLRTEMQTAADRTREIQASAALRQLARLESGESIVSPIGAVVLLGAAARSLVMEAGNGITLGHAEALNVVEWLAGKIRAQCAVITPAN